MYDHTQVVNSFVGTTHRKADNMSTILEEGIGFGGPASIAEDKAKQEKFAKDHPYDTVEANFPSSSADPFRVDLSLPKYVTNLDPALKERCDRIKDRYPNTDFTPSSGMNADVLATAIQVAKAVRKQALDNAKQALEEAFSKKYNEMSRNIVPQKITIEPPIEGVGEAEIQEIIAELENECNLPKETIKELQKQIPTASEREKNLVLEALRQLKDDYITKESKDSDTVTEPSVVDKRFSETKKMIETFREKVAKYPKHLSYEGSMVLCVLLSMKEIAHPSLNNLPMVDQTLIRALVPNKFLGDLDYFSVTFDNEKDFDMKFSCRSESDPYLMTMFNSVAHPRPEDLKDIGAGVVPIEKNGDKISVGGKIMIDKKGIKRLIGMEPLKRDKRVDQEDEHTTPRRQPVAGRNAFEIRTDIMQMAVDYGVYNKINDPNEIVEIAKQFYEFVENKHYGKR